MYKKLLISSSGGIVPRNMQSEQAEVATIAIGLGGTGIKCLSELKNEVHNKIKTDADSDISEYKHIKFLAIDSDSTSSETDNIYSIDKNTEFLDIGCRDTIGLLKSATVENDSMFDWLGTDLSLYSAESGAGGIRQIGRLLFLLHSNAFICKLEQLITDACAGLPSDVPLNIHIFTSLGGGTGSGIFLDVCYLIKYVLDKLLLKSQSTVCGFFFLPDINLSEVSSTHVRDYIKANSFAAMKELDYCMSFSINGAEWQQQYNDFYVKSSEQPVDLSFLVSAIDVNGAIMSDSMNHATHTVINFVLEYIIKSYGSSQPSLKSFSYMCKNYMRMAPKKCGACYYYCVLGSANAHIPYKDIITYLASKIFESFNYLNKSIPNENDLDLFIHSNGLKYEDISRELNAQLRPVPLYAVDTKILQEQCEGITPDTIPQVLSPMRDSIPKISGVLETNKKNLTNGAENTLVENAKNISSLISRVKKSLIQITADPAKGPYYAAAFLHSNATKDLQNKIDGYITTNDEALAYARADLGMRDQSMANALREFQNAKGLKRKSKGETYVASVHGYFLQVAKIDNLVALGDLLKEFKKQLECLYSDYFKIFTTVLDNLTATFTANLKVLAEPIETIESYSKPLMTILDLKESLDTSVAQMRILDIVNHFIDAFVNDEKVWIAQDENKISVAVTKFFLSELDEFTNKTIIDYLQIKFKTTDPNLLRKKIYDEIMIPAHNAASPLFWSDASKYQISDASKIGYCSVPVISPEIQGASDDLHNFDNTIQRQVVESFDRVSILQMFIGVPLFAYKGVSAYYNYYNKHKFAGLHIYEGYGKSKKDYRNLPDIIPFSAIGIENCTEIQLLDSAEYDFAKENKIIEINNVGDCFINIFDSEEICILENTIEKKANGINDICKNVSDMPMVISKIFIPNDGVNGYQEIVCEDNVLNSLYLMQQVKEQNNLFRRYNSLRDKLKGAAKCE